MNANYNLVTCYVKDKIVGVYEVIEVNGDVKYLVD
jgi:hypothetical protein